MLKALIFLFGACATALLVMTLGWAVLPLAAVLCLATLVFSMGAAEEEEPSALAAA
jgi:hypothetical protein